MKPIAVGTMPRYTTQASADAGAAEASVQSEPAYLGQRRLQLTRDGFDFGGGFSDAVERTQYRLLVARLKEIVDPFGDCFGLFQNRQSARLNLVERGFGLVRCGRSSVGCFPS